MNRLFMAPWLNYFLLPSVLLNDDRTVMASSEQQEEMIKCAEKCQKEETSCKNSGDSSRSAEQLICDSYQCGQACQSCSLKHLTPEQKDAWSEACRQSMGLYSAEQKKQWDDCGVDMCSAARQVAVAPWLGLLF